MKRIAILTAGTLPVPPVKGGAVENLIQLLINENENNTKVELNIFSVFNKDAVVQSKNYGHTNFIFIKIPFFIKILDYLTYIWFTKVLQKKKKMSYRSIFSRLYYIFLTGLILHKNNYSNVILENHATLYLCIKLFNNYKKYYGKYVYHIHNEFSGFYGCLKEIKNTAIIIGVSNYVVDRVKKQVNGFSEHTKFFVLKNKIDREKFLSNVNENKEKELRKKLNVKTDTQIVLFTGRMNREKGIDILIKAWNLLELSNSVLLIVGSYYFNSSIKNSKYQYELNSLIKKSKNIRFTGYISYEEMPNVYALADLVVLPSMWDDPAPLTVIESLTMGKPLITTYSGGIPEYANSGNSILLERNDFIINNLAIAIDKVFNNKELRDNLRKNALESSADWTSAKYFDNFLFILNN